MITALSKRRGTILPPPFNPYDYQAPIIKKMVETIIQGKNGLVIQPTATGKSVESAFTSRACILLHQKRGLYLYDENEGLHQALISFEKIFNKNKITCAKFFGYGKDKNVEEADMVFASFQSLNNHQKKAYLAFAPDHFDYIIVNEGHHAQATTYKEVLTYFICPKIGMTATPKRMDEKDILEIFDEVIYEILLEEAIVKGWVAQIEYHLKSHGLSTQKLKKICSEVLEEGKRISIKQLNETIFIELLDEEIKKEIYFYAFPEDEKPLQTLIFCENIEHANNFLKLLQKDGVSAECVHSHKTPKQNRVSMNHFRQGKIQFLLSVDKLNEDIDVPGVELGVFLRATDSQTIFFQQLGRLLRKTKTKHKAIILDFVANVERLILVEELVNRVSVFGGNSIPLDKTQLYVSGVGYNFNFSDELVNVIEVLKRLNRAFYKSWQEASDAAIKLGIMGTEDYSKKYKKDFQLPCDPKKQYKDFPGFPQFLAGKDWRELSSFSEEITLMGTTKFEPNVYGKSFFDKYQGSKHIKRINNQSFCSPQLARFIIYLVQKEKTLIVSGWESGQVISKRAKIPGFSKKINNYIELFGFEWRKDIDKVWSHGNYTRVYSPEFAKKLIDFAKKKKE